MPKSSLTQYACLVMWCDVTPLKNSSFFFSPFRIIHPNENIIIIIHLANNDDEDWQSYLVADDGLKNSPSSLSYLKRPLLVKWNEPEPESLFSHILSLCLSFIQCGYHWKHTLNLNFKRIIIIIDEMMKWNRFGFTHTQYSIVLTKKHVLLCFVWIH